MIWLQGFDGEDVDDEGFAVSSFALYLREG